MAGTVRVPRRGHHVARAARASTRPGSSGGRSTRGLGRPRGQGPLRAAVRAEHLATSPSPAAPCCRTSAPRCTTGGRSRPCPTHAWVTVRRNRHLRPGAARRRASRAGPSCGADDVRHGVTTPLRTVLDCARVAPVRRGARRRRLRPASARRHARRAASTPPQRLRGTGARSRLGGSRPMPTGGRRTRSSRCCARCAIEEGFDLTPQLQIAESGLYAVVDLGSEAAAARGRGRRFRAPRHPQGPAQGLPAAHRVRRLRLVVAAVLLRGRDVRAGLGALGAALVARRARRAGCPPTLRCAPADMQSAAVTPASERRVSTAAAAGLATACPRRRSRAGVGAGRGVRASRCAAPARRPRRPPAPAPPRHHRPVGEEGRGGTEPGQLLQRHHGGRQHPHLTGRVPGQQVARTHPRAVVGLGRGAGGLLAGRHPGGEDPGVVAPRLELRGHPVRPPPQVGHRQPHPALLLDLAHGGRGVRRGRLGRDPHGRGELRQPGRRHRQGVVGGVDPATGEDHRRRRERHRRHPPLHVDLRPRDAPSRTSITVAAARGSTTTRSAEASHAAARSPSPGSREIGWSTTRRDPPASAGSPPATTGSVPDVDDDLDLDRRPERQRRDADGRAGVHPGVAERRGEQLARRR